MNRNKLLSQEEAEARSAMPHGYRLIDRFGGTTKDHRFHCLKHDYTQSATPKNIFKGMRLRCCHKEHMAAVLSKSMKGSGNPFFGRSHSAETRRKLSEDRMGEKHPMYGKKKPAAAIEKHRLAILGRPRDAETKRKLSEHNLTLKNDIDHCIKKAATSKTRGKRGYFYVADVGDGLLKFGSTTSSISYRAQKLRAYFPDAKIIFHAHVDDAAGYEAAMMERHKKHWAQGELFHDFRSQITTREAMQ